jgi:hypothetical protein
MEVTQNNIEEKKKLVEAANFVLKKFLAETNLLEKKEKILEEELRRLEQTIKMRKIKNIIDKND